MFDKLFTVLNPGPAVPAIEAPELQKKLKGQQKPFLLDVRSPGEFKGGHIIGARLIPLDELASHNGNLPKSRSIVVVCASGRRSKKACRQLLAEGYADVTNLNGGMMAWKRAKLPVKK